ncbi:glycoside hydrolase family 2 protein [Acidipropionibacterium timonense]|uniref:glycoside hydrolase family 2 protein n=1 Tax=Acidipropionibacterium timonense TaxID=2161818 RepID=UPI0010307428|nr:glycoside hydrolase family 2 TIM barrel-domain containing protein [Acidipropionibacterium timonense]
MTTSAAQIVCAQRASQQDGRYPRPLLVRDAHVALDREVGFAVDDDLVGLQEGWHRRSDVFDRQILLPFPPESQASGIVDPGPHRCFWYRIELTADDLERAGRRPGHRLLLHFGAVDHSAMVFVDGMLVGTHEGGQTPFSIDLTDSLDPQGTDHVVTVRALDDPLDIRQPRGKQDWQDEPHVIWYQRTSGIWRTVWLEWVPPVRVERLVWRPDVLSGGVLAHVELDRRPDRPMPMDVAVALDGTVLGQASTLVSDEVVDLLVPLDVVRNGCDLERILWFPERPTLLDAAVVLGDDVVTSYLGYRIVGSGPAGLTINSIPMTLRSVLEQGYWPTSHLTAPSVEAMREEVQLMLDLGFNNCRIHQKVEDPRFLFQCDRLGLSVWGETAAAYAFDSLAVQRFTHEWVDVVRANEGHPSIIAWTPFNESWGITHVSRNPAEAAFSRGVSDLTRALDPTRPVISNDGWEHTDSDLFTIHDYEWRREVLVERYRADGLEAMRRTAGPAGRVLVVGDHQRADVPVLLTEFGGVEYVPQQVEGETWGYSTASDAADYERRIRDIIEPVRDSPVLRGFCWTQLTDTLQEANGLCDENRVPKIPAEIIRALITGQD